MFCEWFVLRVVCMSDVHVCESVRAHVSACAYNIIQNLAFTILLISNQVFTTDQCNGKYR